ncbi:hypothetical protein BGX26_002740 [Mortierella sp. AD094]|nr:hypothetical protein BGX26_002740 [Mortierella sp. AD094]
MKSIAAIASTLAVIATASAIGPVDPKKLPTGWCMMYTDGCAEDVAPVLCGANSTISSTCNSTFSNDLVCTSFKVSCLCTPAAGGEQKDISLEALNKTFELMPSPSMCINLIPVKNSTGPGLVSGDYKPEGKKPNASATTSAPTTSATADTPKSGAATLQMALSSLALVALSLSIALV